jgi:hypothetical protein
MLAVLIGFGAAAVRNEAAHQNDHRTIAIITAAYALMCVVVVL